MQTPQPPRDPEIALWAQINAERCQRAAREAYRRQQAQRVNQCVDAFMALEAARSNPVDSPRIGSNTAGEVLEQPEHIGLAVPALAQGVCNGAVFSSISQASDDCPDDVVPLKLLVTCGGVPRAGGIRRLRQAFQEFAFAHQLDGLIVVENDDRTIITAESVDQLHASDRTAGEAQCAA